MNHVILGRKALFDNLLLCLQRLWKHWNTPWVVQLISNFIVPFVLPKIETFLLEMRVLETWFIDLELLQVLIKLLLRLNDSSIHQLIIDISSQLMSSFSLPDLSSVKMLLHYLPVGLSLFVILEQVLFDIHRIRIVIASKFMFYAWWVHQVVHLNEVGLFLHALSICVISLLVINPTV